MNFHQGAVDLVEVWRGPHLESLHRGHAVICDQNGEIVEAWGDPDAVIYPRSSAKLMQALPLIESGAADAFGLTERQVAFACASHRGAALHVAAAKDWVAQLGLSESALVCGPQTPEDTDQRDDLIRAGESPCRYHNNCSGKHSGFLTLTQHLRAGPDYVALDHPVQTACKAVIEDVCVEDTKGHGIDGCSAPNFATSLVGLARSAAFFASASGRGGARAAAAVRLVSAIKAHPALLAGEGGADTALIRATQGQTIVKTGAEGVYIAVLPEQQLGVALKIADGTTRASECVMTALLVRLGVLDPAHPVVSNYMTAPIRNWDGLVTGQIRPAATLQ